MQSEVRFIARLATMLVICIIAMLAGETTLMWFAFSAAIVAALDY